MISPGHDNSDTCCWFACWQNCMQVQGYVAQKLLTFMTVSLFWMAGLLLQPLTSIEIAVHNEDTFVLHAHNGVWLAMVYIAAILGACYILVWRAGIEHLLWRAGFQHLLWRAVHRAYFVLPLLYSFF